MIPFATALRSGLVTAHSAPPLANRISEPVVIYYEAGGSGVCIWTAGSYIVSQVTAPLPVGKAPNADITPVLRQWSEDLRVLESTLRTPDGIVDLWRRFADGTAGFAEKFVKVWAARRRATVPAPPLLSQPAPPPPSEPAKTAPR